MNRLSGELTLATVNAGLRAVKLDGTTLDLAQVTRADSAGIALLLELTRRAKATGNTLKIENANEQIRGLIRFFGVDSVLNLQ